MTIEFITNHHVGGEVLDFIQKSSNGGMFHSPVFLSYHGDSKFGAPDHEVCHLVIRSEEGILGFMPGMKVARDGRVIYRSPFGSSYGGLVHSAGLVFTEMESLIDAICAALREKFDEVQVIPPADIYTAPDPALAAYQHFLWMKNGYQVVSADMLLCAHHPGNAELEKTFHRKTQTELRQAMRNDLRLERDDRVREEDYAVLLSSQQRLGGTPTHTLPELDRIAGLMPGKLLVFRTLHGDIVVGGIVCFVVSDSVLNTFYIYDDVNWRQLKPNHFAYYQVLKFAFDSGFRFVDFGPGTTGFNPNHPLIFFKEKFGAKPHLRITYRIEHGLR